MPAGISSSATVHCRFGSSGDVGGDQLRHAAKLLDQADRIGEITGLRRVRHHHAVVVDDGERPGVATAIPVELGDRASRRGAA